MAATFSECVAFTLQQEGGYADNPDDSGGPTNFGITQQTLSDWLGYAVTSTDVQNMAQATAIDIYQENYWNAVRGDSLPIGVDLLVFDFAVNAGQGTSAEILQQVLGVDVDGDIGPITLLAAKGSDQPELIANLAQAHIDNYRADPSFATFGAGWIARTERAEAQASLMLQNATQASADPDSSDALNAAEESQLGINPTYGD